MKVTYRGHSYQYVPPAEAGGLWIHAAPFARPGDIVVDAGAYRGAFTVLAPSWSPGGMVSHCRTAIPGEAEREHQLNRLDNVVVRDSVNGRRMTFCEYGEDYSAISPDELRCNVNQRHVANGEVDVVALDHELGRLGVDHVDFIKMDIEGAEIEAMKGAKKILMGNDVKVAIASYHEVEGQKTCYTLERYLTDLGYLAETNFPLHMTTYAHRPMIE